MLRIVDWDKHFENAKSREIKNLTWVPFPNKQDGDGYTELLDHKDGPEQYGAWCAIVQVASKCHPRGTLIRDSGLPHDPTSLSRMTRFPKAIIAATVKRLIFEIGWLEYVSQDGTRKALSDYSQEGATESHQSATASHPGTLEQKGTEGKRREEKEQKGKPPAVDFFDEFWKSFPPKRRTKKGKARIAWERAVKKAAPEIIIAAAAEYAASPVASGKYVQGPEPWLNGECWDDERESWSESDGSPPVSRVVSPEEAKHWNPTTGFGEVSHG